MPDKSDLAEQFTKLRAALSARLLQWRKIHASTGGQYRSSYEEGRDNMLMDCIEGLTADVQAGFSQTEEDKTSMATAPGNSSTAETPYFIEVEENGCSACSAGRMWIVVGPDGAGGGTSYGDEEAAQEVADLMNEAYHIGKAQRSPSPAVAIPDATPQGLREPYAYVCPANCGCMWRDNKDFTMSLFGARSQSCEVCEPLGLGELIPVYVAMRETGAA